MSRWSAPRGRDVDRHVADEPHALPGGVRAQRAPLAVEADLVVQRGPASVLDPPLDPVGLALAERVGLVARHLRVRVPGAVPARPRRPSAPCTGSRSGRADRAAGSATRTVRRRPASRRTRTRRRPADPTAATSDAAAHRAVLRCSSGFMPFRSCRTWDRRGLVPTRAERQPPPRIQIEHPEPIVDCGRYPAKRTVGDTVAVSADIFRDGHEVLRAVVRWRGPAETDWNEAPMRHVDAAHAGSPLGGLLPGRRRRPLDVHDRGVDGRVRVLA